MQDLLLLDQLLNEDERLIANTVRRFVDEEVLALMPEAFERGRFPVVLVSKIA